MDRPMSGTGAVAANDVEIDDQALRLRAADESAGAECVPECVPARRADLRVHSAPQRRITDRIERIGTVILRVTAVPVGIRGRVDVELRDRIAWQLRSDVEYPVAPMCRR